MPTLLCIDDETYGLSTRVAWLRAHGYKVIVANTTDAVLDYLVSNPIDAVLLDCHMDPSGRIATLVRKISEELPIVVLASYCSVPCPQKNTVMVCLGKGEQPTALLQALQALVGNGPVDDISPRAA